METVWILYDQLSLANAALAGADKERDVVLISESKARGQFYTYHQQKLVLVVTAMRHFARDLETAGWRVDYHRLGDTPDYETGLRRHIERYQPARLRVAAPNDWDMARAVEKLRDRLGIEIEVVPTRQFLCDREEFAAWAGDSRHLRMETHYRRMRTKTGYLMEADGRPTGGAWNFDRANRCTYKEYAASGQMQPAVPHREPHDDITVGAIADVERDFADHFGRARDFWFPADRAGALRWLKRFIAERLERFGPFEDVMAQGHPVIYHSILSPVLNLGLLSPAECAEAAIASYRAGRAPIESVEGFLRQIIGWREFINGVYWRQMPEYKQLNALEAERPVPAWFYTGETKMNCLHHAIAQALDLGWIHHIQRLMVVGNFFLIAGINPQLALKWYLEVTVDAYDWVMAPNVIGMILHADAGYMSSKPYAATSAYIHKMSNYCESCRYKPEVKTGPDACPYNYLFWDFYDRHADRFRDHPRVGALIRSWDKRPEASKRAVRESAREFLEAGCRVID